MTSKKSGKEVALPLPQSTSCHGRDDPPLDCVRQAKVNVLQRDSQHKSMAVGIAFCIETIGDSTTKPPSPPRVERAWVVPIVEKAWATPIILWVATLLKVKKAVPIALATSWEAKAGAPTALEMRGGFGDVVGDMEGSTLGASSGVDGDTGYLVDGAKGMGSDTLCGLVDTEEDPHEDTKR
ncbi:unnamed protein product [Ilex paraguariensis]|uniref:Uncharacterized protein n=1 Tax=Ilex paraguariensis TaxID=185542 RepID=A0ABC8SGN5_9AQUA